jgi:hypothetical protein
MRDVGKLIAHTSAAMEEKLREKDDSKGDWEGLSFNELERLSDAEVVERKMALYIYQYSLCKRIDALKALRREAADCANYNGMIIQKCDRLISEMER